MPRVKHAPSSKARRKEALDRAKGYRGGRSKLLRTAKEAADRAGQYAYAHRRQKKRTFRALWIVRINAAAHHHGLNYSQFIHGLAEAGVEINRKVLASLAVSDPQAFGELAEVAKAGQVSA